MADTSRALSSSDHAAVPFWRDVRVLRWLFQIVVLLLVIGAGYWLINNLLTNLKEVGLSLDFGFITRPAGFDISEGPPFEKTDPIWKAYTVAISNTVRVVVAGIILTTILGVIVGIMRLSQNWLARQVALIFIEVLQNTPLLLQLFFWFVLIRALPALRKDEVAALPSVNNALGIPPIMYFSQRGAAVPGIEALPSFGAWLPYLIAGIVLAIIAGYAWTKYKERQGRPPVGQFWVALATLIVILALGWVIVPDAPIRLTMPTLESVGDGPIVRYLGGWELSNSFQAILFGLVLYTAAFVAEVVRAGIQAVPHGQIEAATALGFPRGQQLRLIILPQALRVIIPPLINQYLNLAKNSSLAIAVAFPDIYNISQSIGNHTGQSVQVVIIMMSTYLIFSLVISLIMNIVNKNIQIVER